MQPLTVSRVQLLYTVQEKGGTPDRKTYGLYGLRNPYRNLKSRTPRLCPETSTTLHVHEFDF